MANTTKMLRSRHTGVMFGYTEAAAKLTTDYEVVEMPKPKKKRARRRPPQEITNNGADDS